ncbi:MAG: hypothetical protein ACON4Z_01130 [Planctomycetota bacterium]
MLTSSSKRALLCAATCLLALTATGCSYHRHSIGLGATGTGEQQARQYYVLFGLVRTNDVSAQRMADGLTSYTIETRYGFYDLLLQPLLLPLTMTSRTVRVRT